jgi:purine-binding chemotaxis protein CheW
MKFYSQFSEIEQAILEARAKRIANVTKKDADEHLITALVVGIGSETYALPIDSLKTVHENIGIVSVPCVPSYVAGIANIRGHIIPVLNLGILMYGSEAVTDEHNALIEVTNDTMTVAFLVEKVGEITAFSANTLSPVPAETEGRRIECLEGIFPDGTGLIDVQAILDDKALTVAENVQH